MLGRVTGGLAGQGYRASWAKLQGAGSMGDCLPGARG